jgi:hypothetical protein
MLQVSPVEYSGQTAILSVRLEILPNFAGLEVYELGQEYSDPNESALSPAQHQAFGLEQALLPETAPVGCA